jgi:predicted Ser/Thr protein kinase
MNSHAPTLDLQSAPGAARRRLGKYEIIRILGQGAMGTVYEAVDPDIGRTVAVKTMALAADDEEASARFLKEAQAAGRLAHPGIATVYEYGVDDGLAYIAMEFIEGQSLDQMPKPGIRLSDAEIVDILCQLLDALGHAHAKGVVHRDIKPANIVRKPDGCIKLIDFGIARTADSHLTQAHMLLGTPIYMAPEQLLGSGVDHRVDIYACGVTLYVLLARRPPFIGTVQQLQHKVLHERHVPPSKVAGADRSVLWDAIVDRALAKEPDQRYQTAAEFRQALSALLANEPSAQPGVGGFPTPAASCQSPLRSRLAKACLIGVAAGLFAAGALLAVTHAAHGMAGRQPLWAEVQAAVLPSGRWHGQVDCGAPMAGAAVVLANVMPAEVEVVGGALVIAVLHGQAQHKLYAVLGPGADFQAKGLIHGPSQRAALEAQGTFDGRPQAGRVSARLALVRLRDGQRLQACDLTAQWRGPA